MKLKKHEVKISNEIVQQRHLKNLMTRYNSTTTLKPKKLMNRSNTTAPKDDIENKLSREQL